MTAVFLIALLSFTITYTVRFTEAAVVTTFGKADKSDVHDQPGLGFKWPYPIQSVTTYDTRVRVLSSKFEQIATADARQVVVETFCTWRVKDPLVFFRRFSSSGDRADDHFKAAEAALRQNLRSAAGQVSRYRMDELFNSGRGGSKLPELEAKMLAAFQEPSGQTAEKLANLGVEAVDIGLTRVVLTEEVTKSVFERMKAAQEKYARATQSRGQAEAESIRTNADKDAKRIELFADRLAQNIRSQGDLEAAPYLQQMAGNPELAVFQSNMDFIRDVYGKRMTLVVSGSMPGMWMLWPDALDSVKSGTIPKLTKASQTKPKAEAAAGSDSKTPESGGSR
jgi:membrane protease subunit HflC